MNYKEKFKNLPRTPWFNASIRPAHIGVYERFFGVTGMILLNYWDGEYWKAGVTPTSVRSLHQDKLWRGCTERFTSYSVFDTTKT